MGWSEVHEQVTIQSLALFPFSLLYGLGWEAYELAYRIGLKKPVEPHCPVVVVGNLQVGGTGKSPITVLVAHDLMELGEQVVISASGYGSPKSVEATVAPDGPLAAQEWGDEPAMLRDLLPDIPLIVGRNRVRAAEICHERFPNAVLLLDDGLQHKPLKKHITILLDPEQPMNRFLLPAGPYREPRWYRNRYDIVIPKDFEFKASLSLVPLGADTEALAPGSEVQLLSSIAKPYRLMGSLDLIGLKLVRGRQLPDHHPLLGPAVLKGFDPAVPLVMTRKDWVKFRDRPDAIHWNVHLLELNAHLEPRQPFRQKLRTLLDETKTKRA